MQQKEYTIHIFGSDGSTFVKNLPPETLKNKAPEFRSKINGGYSECVLDLNLPFDDFDEGTSIDFMNIVDIYAIDSENPRGRRIYRGFISKYEPYIEASEGVRVTLLGLVSLLSFSYYKNGANFEVVHAAADPEAIMRAIIDHFNTIYSGTLITYDNDTTDTVGENVSITYTDTIWSEALKKAAELADDGWWWKIDENGYLWLKAKPSTSTHTFTIGKDIDAITAPKDCEKVVNDVVVRYDGGTATDDDATSIAAFGTRSEIVSDTMLKDATAGTQRAAKEIGDNKDEKVKAVVTINNNYDLESIKAGETCRILNVRKGSAFFGDNMQIVAVQYMGDTVRIELAEEPANFASELDSFVNT
jgi:hypothetical protein